jgi:hypothetical protein
MPWTHRRLGGSLAAGLIGTLLVAGCGAAGPSGTAPASPSTSASATASATAAPTLPSPSTPGTTDVVADPRGDASLDYVDVVELRADVRAGQLELALRVAAPPPASSVEAGVLTYAFGLDLDGDGQPDKSAELELVPEGGFRPVLVDLATGRRLEGAQFPGTAGLTGANVTLSVALDALACPASIGVRGSSHRTGGGTTIRDDVPDPAAGPLVLKTGC